MRRILLLVLWHFALLAGTRLFADVVTLKDGSQIAGLLETGNTQELQIKVGDRSQAIDVHQVQTIQLGASSASPPAAPQPPKATDLAPKVSEAEPAQPNTLILKDGTNVTGRWWSIDATNVHFLVNNQIQQYSRQGVSGVTFGNATLPPPTPHSTPNPASAAPPPASAAPPPASAAPPPASAPPARAPTLTRSSDGPPAQRPTLTRPASPAQEPARGLSHPDEIGMVYYWNGKVVIPLERNRAVERKNGSTQYWEMAGPRSTVRLAEDSSLVFVVGLPSGVDPASYSLFQLDTVNGGRRTRAQGGRRGGPATWPVDIVKKDDAAITTYVFTVRDLPIGEYSFSPSSSNDGYCFGVDPSGQ